MNELSKRVKALEERVSLLETRKRSGKLKEMADWIMLQFAEKSQLPVDVIMRRARKKGYSTQMVQRARRELLTDSIVVGHGRGIGWTWNKEEE